MIINELSLTNFRGYESAMFTFQPGVNLIAGVNGAGKSTALNALRILMSRASRAILKSREGTVDVGPADIRRNADFAYISVEFVMPFEPARTVYQFEGQVNREDFVPSKREGDVRDEGATTQSGFDFVMPKPLFLAPGGQPLCLFFSPHRSLLTQEATTGAAQTSAFAQALGERRFNLRQVSDWWLVQEGLAGEGDRFDERSSNLLAALWNFLPEEIAQVRPNRNRTSAEPEILVRKDNQDFNLFTLSDGEKGMIAICLEIARRLNLAYPDLGDPAGEGSACVLIDEIELHLHPLWQREILHRLAETFPKCQFIATTHSPQVIGEVEADRIWYVANGKVWQQDQALGLDSSRVLEELMGGRARNAETEEALSQIAELVDQNDLDAAKRELRALQEQLGENDPDVIRASGLIDFLETPVDPD